MWKVIEVLSYTGSQNLFYPILKNNLPSQYTLTFKLNAFSWTDCLFLNINLSFKCWVIKWYSTTLSMNITVYCDWTCWPLTPDLQPFDWQVCWRLSRTTTLCWTRSRNVWRPTWSPRESSLPGESSSFCPSISSISLSQIFQIRNILILCIHFYQTVLFYCLSCQFNLICGKNNMYK